MSELRSDLPRAWAVLACAGFAAALLVAGCGVRYRATARVTPPSPMLVQVQPGVWVVSQYDVPVFWSDGAYWRWSGGVWYRSSWLGGWTPVGYATVPRAVARIDRPGRYRDYRVPRGVTVRPVPRAHVRVRPRGTVVRPQRRGAVVRPRGAVRPRGDVRRRDDRRRRGRARGRDDRRRGGTVRVRP